MLETILSLTLLVIAYFPIRDFIKKILDPEELISGKDIAWLSLSAALAMISGGLFSYTIFV